MVGALFVGCVKHTVTYWRKLPYTHPTGIDLSSSPPISPREPKIKRAIIFLPLGLNSAISYLAGSDSLIPRRVTIAPAGRFDGATDPCGEYPECGVCRLT
jgi:hypothetical protein